MRHHNTNRKFGREKTQRHALLNSLVFNLIVREKIKITLPKAKELRPVIEKLVTHAKKSDLATKRLIISKLISDFILLTNIDFPSKKLMGRILNVFEKTNIDFEDIHLFFTASFYSY